MLCKKILERWNKVNESWTEIYAEIYTFKGKPAGYKLHLTLDSKKTGTITKHDYKFALLKEAAAKILGTLNSHPDFKYGQVKLDGKLVSLEDLKSMRIGESFNEGHAFYKMSKTYQVVSPESAEQGDYEEADFEYKDKKFDSLEDMAEEIESEGFVEPSSSSFHHGIYYTSVDPEQDYKTGNETTYSFHPKMMLKDEQELFNLVMKKK